MSKRRGADDRKRLDPEDVLAGRVKVGAAELLDLIHRVNPTGRGLGARDPRCATHRRPVSRASSSGASASWLEAQGNDVRDGQPGGGPGTGDDEATAPCP
jgi:hypothetical protein